MSILWVLPPVILLVGLTGALLLLRAIDAAAAEVRAALLTVADIEGPIRRTRAETERARAALDQLGRR